VNPTQSLRCQPAIHKWWAKRLGSVFRAILLGSALPETENLEDVFYRKHDFRGQTVFDPFMGSGTTIGEAHKLGFTTLGRDINLRMQSAVPRNQFSISFVCPARRQIAGWRRKVQAAGDFSARFAPACLRFDDCLWSTRMSDDSIRIEYNQELKPLEELIEEVQRPGDFCVSGSQEIPMPKVEVDGVGTLSFPVPENQIQQLIRQATRAPYGRGEETILDESVRKVWQLRPEKVRIGGKSWAANFEVILQQVIKGLGCEGLPVTAELYKLLVYDTGGFFLAHRDTEKTGGMFGTLVVVLPSEHRGGELVLRHAGREVVVDMAGGEISEVKLAAFYADCEHEVRPIMAGNRVCLVYNLVQQRDAKAQGELLAPDYENEISAAAKLLREHLVETGAPAKIAWLLEHQYSPEGLSFAGLKSADAARTKVLVEAAKRADCVAHLGIVHIEESGAANPTGYDYRPRRWGRYYEDENEEEDSSSEDFEVIDVCDCRHYVAQWRDLRDEPVDFGELPLEQGELLPDGALDDEKPDEQRLMEASGNEGASFERSYHRAALVIWPRERFAGVLLQAGVSAAMPHLRERIEAGDKMASSIARQIIKDWETPRSNFSYRSLGKEPDRAAMLELLLRLNDGALLQRFISGIVTREFDGSENKALAAAFARTGASSSKLLVQLFRANMPLFHRDCVSLLGAVRAELGAKMDEEWKSALTEAVAEIVKALPKIMTETKAGYYSGSDWRRREKSKPVDAAMVAQLLEHLRALNAKGLRRKTADAITENQSAFDPADIIVPALRLIADRERNGFVSDADCGRLWVHAAEFLLGRSEQPPIPPTDWKQPVSIACKCEDCRALQTFVLDAQSQVARFRVKKERRQHLHGQIEQHRLDMTHVTERKGSPQTLVCAKTRRTYQRQCDQHRADCVSMGVLLDVMKPPPESLAKFAARLRAAKERKAKDV
jgi:hypothetical protein